MYIKYEENFFITYKGTYYYKAISFSLKNIKAIYQKMVDKIFWDQLERNMKAYIEDMFIKSLNFKDIP